MDFKNVKIKNYEEEEKLAIYRRISVGDDVKNHKGQSLQAQWDNCIQYISKIHPNYNLNNVKDYCDDGISAKRVKSDREELMRLMLDVKNLKVTKIFVARQDRFTRQLRDLDLYWILEAYDIDLISVDNGQNLNDKSPMGRFMRNLQIALAELEVELTSERQRETKQAMFHSGKFRGGFLPYGFKWHYDENLKDIKIINQVREIAIVPEEKLVFQKILHKFFDENKGTTVIANELTMEGIPFRTGEKKTLSSGEFSWNSTNILEILRNPLWMGKQAKNKYKTKINEDGSKSRQRLSPRDWELENISNMQEVVISEETYWGIVEKLESRQVGSDMSPRKTQTSWLLSGLLYCECGTSMKVKNPRKDYKYYKCQNPLCKSELKTLNKLEIEEEALKIIAKAISEKIEDFDLQEAVVLKLNEAIQNTNSNIDSTKAQIKNVEEDIKDLQVEYIKKKDEPNRRTVIENMIFQLQEKKENLEKSLTHQEQQLNENIDKAINFRDSLQALSLLENVFKVDYYDDKDLINIQRSLLLSFANKFYIKEGELKITFRKEDEGIPKYLLGRLNKEVDVSLDEVFNGMNEVSATNEKVMNQLESLVGLIHELHPRFIQTDVLISSALSNLTNKDNGID
jgi:site-specific DNA recombinase